MCVYHIYRPHRIPCRLKSHVFPNVLQKGKLHATFPSQSELLLVVVLEHSWVMILEKYRQRENWETE